MLIYPTMKRVVITGIGAVTPLGNTIDETWNKLVHGVSGIGPVTKFDPSGLPSRIAGEVKSFRPENYLSPKEILRLDPFVHYAAAAARMACEDAGLIGSSIDAAGVVIGSSRGGMTSMEKALEGHLLRGKHFSAYLMSSSTINMAASCISMKLGIKGPAIGISTACASGTNAIGEAFRMVRSGDMKIALAGGADAPVCRTAAGGYGASGSLSRRNDRPEKASRPFDRDRDGFVISEGSCVAVLEDLEHAIERGAPVYAEVAGYGTTSDAFHQTKPDSEGESAAITKALADAYVPVEEVDYVNAHGTSTPLGDRVESEAVQKVFGRRSGEMLITSCKSMLGHMLAAAGAVEAAITALSLYKGIITPTINLDNKDQTCSINVVTETMEGEIRTAISNSFGFGGVNAVLVLKKFHM